MLHVSDFLFIDQNDAPARKPFILIKTQGISSTQSHKKKRTTKRTLALVGRFLTLLAPDNGNANEVLTLSVVPGLASMALGPKAFLPLRLWGVGLLASPSPSLSLSLSFLFISPCAFFFSNLLFFSQTFSIPLYSSSIVCQFPLFCL